MKLLNPDSLKFVECNLHHACVLYIFANEKGRISCRRVPYWEHWSLEFPCSFMKIGTMVFLCHDINDVFMEVAKLSKYAKREDVANVLFAVFVLSWFASRMFYFPLWIIRSAWSEPITVCFLQILLNLHPKKFNFCPHSIENARLEAVSAARGLLMDMLYPGNLRMMRV